MICVMMRQMICVMMYTMALDSKAFTPITGGKHLGTHAILTLLAPNLVHHCVTNLRRYQKGFAYIQCNCSLTVKVYEEVT